MQAVPPIVFKELHNVIPNPVAEAWVVKLAEIKINPSAGRLPELSIMFLYSLIIYRLWLVIRNFYCY
jgi:hypothetical protein